MNPLTNMRNVSKLSEQDLKVSTSNSWHNQYKDSAWIFIGGLPYDLTEGDVICIFSQYGEVVNINLVRDKATGKQKGFCFICYEDQRSTILAVDNLNGVKILGRSVRVDHVADYKAPKDSKNITAETAALYELGCAVAPGKVKEEPPSPEPVRSEEPALKKIKKEDKKLTKKELKKKKKKKEKEKSKKRKKSKKSESKKRRRRSPSTSTSSSSSSSSTESDSSTESSD